MATREIKTRFKLEGEQQFRKAMNEAADSIKVLNAEQKLAKAQFEATGDAQQYAADQSRILKEQIEQQKRAVAAAEEAVKRLTEDGVDPNARIMQTWRTKLNNARTSLTQMQTRLDKVGDELDEEKTGFEGAETAASGFNSEMEKVAQGVNLQNTITAIDTITGHIEAVVKTAAKASKAVWSMGVDAGKWADDLKTAANQAGVDPETYQSWQYASMFIDTSVDDIVRSWQDIQRNMKEGNTDYLVMLNGMKIASMTTENQMRSSEDIFWDAIDYLHGIGDAATQAEKATLLFGNDWRKLNPLISEGSAAYKELAEEGMRVAVVSNEQVDALGSFDYQINDLNARFDKFKYDALAELAPTFETVAKAMSEAVTALDEFIQSDEGREALQGLNEALQGVIGSFLGEDGGKEAFAKIIGTATDGVERFTGAMDWLSENGDTVKDIIIGMGVAWGGLKVAEEVLFFMQLLKAMPLAKLQTLFGGGAAQTAGNIAQAAGGGAGLWSAGSTLASWLSSAAPALATLLALKTGYEWVDSTETEARQEYSQELEAVQKAAQEAAQRNGTGESEAMQIVNLAREALDLQEDQKDIFGRASYDTLATRVALGNIAQMDTGNTLSPKNRLMLRRQQESGISEQEQEKLLRAIMADAADATINPRQQATRESIAQDAEQAMEAIRALKAEFGAFDTPEGIDALSALIAELAESEGVFQSIGEETKDLFGAFLDPETGRGNYDLFGSKYAQELIDSIEADLDAGKDQWKGIGESIPGGLAEGIDAGADAPAEAAADMADGTAAAAKDELDSHSPSRVFEGIGEDIAAGMANGIYARGEDAIAAALWMARSVESIVRSALQIHSPSKAFEELGAFTGLGFAQGIEKSEADVSRAVDTMLRATQRRPEIEIGGASVDGRAARAAWRAGAPDAGAAGTVQVVMMLDKEVLGDVMAPIVNEKIGAQIQATRR